MARISFTDATGPATLENGLGAIAGGVAAQFRGWTPFQIPIGPHRTALGTGARYHFTFRTDYGARFRLEELPLLALPTALRLVAHLLAGGAVRLDTGDSQDRVYTSCGLAPDSEPALELADPTHRLYTLSLALINLASAAPLLCEYADVPTAGALLLLVGPDRLDGSTFARTSAATYATVG